MSSKSLECEYPFLKGKTKKIIVFANRNENTKKFLDELIKKGYSIAFITEDDLSNLNIKFIPTGTYIVNINDEVLIDYIKGSDNIIFYKMDSLDIENYKNLLTNFYKIYDFVLNYNKEINFIFFSTTDVYGNKRKEMLFPFSQLKPNTKKGKVYEIMEEDIKNLPSGKIIRVPEVLTEKSLKEIKLFANELKYEKKIKIPKNKEYINFVYPQTITNIISLLINSKKSIVIHITDTPGITSQIFLQYFAMIYKKNFVISSIPFFSKHIPTAFNYDQNLSTIDQESFGLVKYETENNIMKNLFDIIEK